MNTHYILSLIFISVLFSSVGQILLRKGMQNQQLVEGDMICNVLSCLLKPSILGALFLYIASLIIWMVVLSRTEVSFAYPFSSLGFVFVLIASVMFLGETLHIARIIGVLLVCIGVFIIAKFS